MSDADDAAKFAAREFVARWYRETGEVPSALITDRMLFSYEIGYLRGRTEAAQDALRMYNKLVQANVSSLEGKNKNVDSE